MILDFSNSSQISALVRECLNNSKTPTWKKDIFQFIEWYYSKDLFLVQYTSGSTGTPKPIQLSRETLLASARATNSFFNLGKATNAFLCIPAKYIGGKMMILRAIIGEWELHLTEPKIDLNIDTLAKPCDFTAMIPAQVQSLVDKKVDLKFLFRNIIIGGAQVSESLEELLSHHDGCYSTYGMTETASHVALKHLNHSPYFKALDGITFTSDVEHRLIINGERVPGSPLPTNDVVELTSTTSFLWRGRFDFVINSGGVKIIVEELEKHIATLLEESFYIKKEAHHTLGETPTLVIRSTEWNTENQRSFLKKLKDHLPKYWTPIKLVFKDEFNYTSTGKLLRE